MDAKIITGLLLCFCLIANISISQSAHVSYDGLVRSVRQADENPACPQGTKPCKDDNAKCATYCNGNPECEDASDEIDCVTNPPVTINTIALTQGAETNNNEIDRANVPEDTTDLTEEATLPQISIFDRETVAPADAGSTADGLDNLGTTAASDAADAATLIDSDGTTIVLPRGTTAIINAEDATDSASEANEAVSEANEAVSEANEAVSEANEAISEANEAISEANEAVSEAAEAVSEAAENVSEANEAASEANEAVSEAADAVTGASEAASEATEANEATGASTVVVDSLETSTVVVVDNGTDVFTSVQPGVDGVTDDNAAGNETATDANASTEAAGVTGAAGLLVTTLEPVDDNGNGTQSNDTAGESTTTPAPVVPGGDGQQAAQLRVVVNPEVLPVQYGRTVEFTCIVYGGDANTNVYWIQEQPERRYALLDAANENDKQVTASQVTSRARITLDDPSKIGTYTCMAQDASGNSGSAVLTMQQGGGGGGGSGGVYPPAGPRVAPAPGSRYLRILAPDMTEGDYVEIQCEGVAPEDESSVQWYFNNRLINDEQPLYPRGKTLHIRPISRAYLGNYRCAVPGGSYVEANSVLTFGGAGGPSGTPAPAPLPPPVYGRCSVDEATCRNGQCIPRAYLCDGKNDCGDNSDEACGPNGQAGSDVCQPNEVRCADSTRGRKCVQKFWTCDGDRDCDDGSDEQQSYCQYLPQPQLCQASEFRCTGVNGTNGSPICVPRAFQCDGYTDCPDRSDEIGCAKPTIVSTPERQVRINAGETLVLRCTARGAPAPYINWRLNWGHICGDGSDNGRCSIAQNFDNNDPTLVTCTLTVRNTNRNDAGAYSCEALNNQGFIFAIPDAIVDVVVDGPVPTGPAKCNCNGHSSYCSPDGRCQNCQHNTAGYNCEYCAPGYQGNAQQGTPYDCQPVPTVPPSGLSGCDPSGTYTQRDGRCVCKYNVQGDRCNQCKPSHFYLNPTTPNGCLPCFCSGVSTDCSATNWQRQALALPLQNWNVVPKNFATDRYEAGESIKTRDNGRELALDQSSLGRPANDVLYWKAPKSALGDVVTLYDGNIDVYFANDGDDTQAPSQDEFIWLRGNNIDLVHKLPQSQRFKANTNATYSVPVNERTFTRKDGTYIDRENILMALSDLDTLLIKINPIGGKKSAVLRGVTLNAATQNGYGGEAPTVESCRCPANYTGTSCEKCAEGYGRPHPLVGIYLGQCWACQSICNGRSSTCDRDTGKCSNCQNSEGDRCERCVAGYVPDGANNQCVPPGSVGPGPSTGVYINGKLIDPYGTQFVVDLDGSRSEQRVPVQLINAQAQSVVWTRADGAPLPAGVYQEGNDLVIRNPSAEQAGNYLCTITHPDGSVERFNVYLNYRAGTPAPDLGGPPRVAIQPRTINLKEGQRMIVQYAVTSHEPITVVWNKLVNGFYQPIPSLFTVEPNRLVLNRATPEAAGTYQVVVSNSHGEDKQELNINVEPRRRRGQPQIRLQQTQYQLGQGETIDIVPNIVGQTGGSVTWSKDGSTTLPEGAFAREDGFLRLIGQSSNVGGQYQITVTNARGQSSTQTVYVQWTGQQYPQGYEGGNAQGDGRSYYDVRFQPVDAQSLQVGQDIQLQCAVQGSIERPYEYTYTKDGQPLANNVEVHPNGVLIIRNAQASDSGRYQCQVNFPRAPEVGTQQSSFDLSLGYSAGNAGAADQGANYGYEYGQQAAYVEVTAEPNEATVAQGQTANITCVVKGAQQYTVKWGKYAHDTSLPDYARQEGNSVIISPTSSSSTEQMYLQCQVDVPGNAQPFYAYAPVNIRGGDESSKKKKKRRS